MEIYSHIRLLLQRDVLASCSGEPKAHYNIVEEKAGVTLDIPLCDSSTTLMNPHLLYDSYVQLLTLDLHLT